MQTVVGADGILNSVEANYSVNLLLHDELHFVDFRGHRSQVKQKIDFAFLH